MFVSRNLHAIVLAQVLRIVEGEGGGTIFCGAECLAEQLAAFGIDELNLGLQTCTGLGILDADLPDGHFDEAHLNTYRFGLSTLAFRNFGFFERKIIDSITIEVTSLLSPNIVGTLLELAERSALLAGSNLLGFRSFLGLGLGRSILVEHVDGSTSEEHRLVEVGLIPNGGSQLRCNRLASFRLVELQKERTLHTHQQRIDG